MILKITLIKLIDISLTMDLNIAIFKIFRDYNCPFKRTGFACIRKIDDNSTKS